MEPTKPEFAPATVWRRLANYFVDRILFYVFLFLIGFLLALIPDVRAWFVAIEASGNGILVTIAVILLYVVYFVMFEASVQRTIGKYITQTKVVMRDGSKPPLKNIIGRSFARLIPLEQFSFLTGKYPTGWHDSFSKTLVVPKNYTAEEVKKIDINKLNGSHNRALIVVLVIVGFFAVIAVIGILSSVVLVSLNTARSKGKDAMVRSALSSIRPNAEIYFAQNGNSYSVAGNCYQGMFLEPHIVQSISLLNEYAPVCQASSDSYAVSANLKSTNDQYCVDSNAYAGNGSAVNEGGSAHCVAETETSTSYSGSVNATSTSWQVYHSTKDKFSVLLPAEPRVTSKVNKVTDSMSITYNSYRSASPEALYYISTYIYSSPLDDTPDVVLDNALRGVVGSDETLKVIDSKPGTWNGKTTLNFTLESGNEILKGRLILVDQSHMTALMLETFKKDFNESDYNKFIESFKVN